MTVSMKRNTIIMTRGDTANIQLNLTDSNGGAYVPNDGDVIRFAAKKAYTDENVAFSIIVPNDTLILKIEPRHTKNLDFGKYVYDIQITYANGDVNTFITKQTLQIEEEVD